MVYQLQERDCYVALTHDLLDPKAMMDRVRSPKAGAIVLFAGIPIIAPETETSLTIFKARLATILEGNL